MGGVAGVSAALAAVTVRIKAVLGVVTAMRDIRFLSSASTTLYKGDFSLWTLLQSPNGNHF